MNEAEHLAERYVAVWNEPDPQARRAAIAAPWVPDGVHYVKTREARGYAALEERIVGSHEKNVQQGGYRFRTAAPIQALRNVVTFEGNGAGRRRRGRGARQHHPYRRPARPHPHRLSVCRELTPARCGNGLPLFRNAQPCRQGRNR